ncbi:hypothetical protein BZA70DRAFT_271778 [Myxozyma melibiosi]|uniref:EGF-like domain-containing protein n=1 Tax=Myxozyma melibiosi TaxID=54550 RepID=A0ABR1FEL4_9ASCO
MDAASLQEQQQEQDKDKDKEQDPAASPDDDHQQQEEVQEDHHRTSLSSSLELPIPAIARVVALRQSSDRTLPPLPSRGASSAPVSVSDPPQEQQQQQQQQQAGFSLEKSHRPKTGIVRSKRPPPLNIDQARPGRSASGIGRRVRRMTSSVLGKALPPVVLNDGEPKNTAATAATAATAPTPTYARKNRKRVLGLPWWAFALILFALVVVIIVCVVVPTQISAKRKANRASDSSASTTSSTLPHYPFSPSTTSTSSSSSPSASDVSTAICRKILPCENDGVSSVRNLTCVCICTNDFAGNVCQYASGTACSVYTLADADADGKNVTLGTSIAEVLDDDNEYFAYISLNASTIYDVLTDADVGCSSQNALVSFDTDDFTSTSSTFNITSTVLDFAQILVLDVLQTNKSVSDAAMLQESLQTAFDDDEIDADSGTVYLEYCGVEVDFLTFTATGNGVGGGW